MSHDAYRRTWEVALILFLTAVLTTSAEWPLLAVAAEPGSDARPGRTTVQSDTGDDRAAARTVRRFANPAPIPIPDEGQPPAFYPSTIDVRGPKAAITDVDVTLHNFEHGDSDDIDILLVGPRGQTAVIMSDVGAGDPPLRITDLTLILDDEAARSMPNAPPAFPVTGTERYRPTNAAIDDADSFPAPAPANPSPSSALTRFDGTDPNGIWRHFVVDDLRLVDGSIAGGWSLEITTNRAPAAKSDRYTTKSGTALRRGPARGVLANDRDPDGDRLTVRLVRGPRHGTVRLHRDGSFVYHPRRRFRGTDSFVYQVRDPSGRIDRVPVRIRVTGQRR